MKLSCVMLVGLGVGLGLGNGFLHAEPAPTGGGKDLAALLAETSSYQRLKDHVAYADGLKAEEMPGIVAKVEAARGPGRDDLLQILAGRWVELDPDKALAAARKEQIRNGIKSDVYDAFYGGWAMRDPAGALAAIEKLPENEERAEAVWALVNEMVDTDPAKAKELFNGVTYSNLTSANYLIYWNWAGKNAQEATQALLQRSNFGNERGLYLAMQGTFDRIFEKDPKAAASWLQGLPAEKLRDEIQQRLVNRWLQVDAPAAIAWITSLPDSPTKESQFQWMIFYWRDQEPKAALDYVLSLPDSNNLKTFQTNECISAWARADGPAALDWAQTSPASVDKAANTEQVLKAWGWVDPKAVDAARKALADKSKKVFLQAATNLTPKTGHLVTDHSAQLAALLKDLNLHSEMKGFLAYVDGLHAEDFPKALDQIQRAPETNRDYTFDVLIGRWMEVDPQGAIRSLPLTRELEETDYAKRIIGDVYDALSTKDPERAFAQATQTLAGEERRAALIVTFTNMAKVNPTRAVELIQTQLGQYQSTASPEDYIVPVYTEWAAHDGKAATQSLSPDMREDFRRRAITGIAKGLVRNDPRLATAWLKKLPPGLDHNNAWHDIVDAWSRNDPAAAMKWLQEHPLPKEQDSMIDKVAEEWAGDDAVGAVQRGMSLPAGKERDCLLMFGLAQWTYDDAPAALSWVEALPPSTMRKNSFAVMIGYWSDYDLAGVAHYLSAKPDDAERRDHFAGMAQSWSYVDPVAAAQWVAGLPACPQRDDATVVIAKDLGRSDLAKAVALVETLPPGKARDLGAKNLSNAMFATDHAGAEKWAISIGDPKLREEQIIQVLHLWLEANRAEGEQAVKDSPLSPEAKVQVLKPVMRYKDMFIPFTIKEDSK